MSPIPGIVAAQNLRLSSRINHWSGHFGMPVVFSTTILVNEGLVATNSPYLSFSGWFKTAWGSGQVAWAVDPLGNYDSFFGQDNLSPFFAIEDPAFGYAKIYPFPGPDAHWHHMIATIRGDLPGAQRAKFYVSGIDRTGASVITNANALVGAFDGLPFFVGSDGGAHFSGEMCDLSIWPGVSFFNHGETDIDPHIIAAFRDPVHGIPVDPTVAISLLGTPAIMLVGNASEFSSNVLGSGGSFTVTTGTLTDGVDVVMD